VESMAKFLLPMAHLIAHEMIRPIEKRRCLVGFQCCLADVFQLGTFGECHYDYAVVAIDSQTIRPEEINSHDR
jgi:hypothetical protein